MNAALGHFVLRSLRATPLEARFAPRRGGISHFVRDNWGVAYVVQSFHRKLYTTGNKPEGQYFGLVLAYVYGNV